MSTSNGSVCPTFVVTHAARSDMGMRRMNNQDSLGVMVTDNVATWASRGHLMIVADGMGAHAAGELASKLAVDNIPHTYFKLRDLYPPAALRQAIRDANNVIHSKGQSSIGFNGMGTTCSCLALLPQGALVAHIGDSRVYRLRGQTFEQLTFDHSLVWEMGAAGQMDPEDVPAYIPKNVITRSLGPHATVHVDLEGPYNAAPGDVFLLCSDGLSGPITDEEMGAILQCLPPNEAVETLVDLANLRGGPDNISLIVARVENETPPPLEQAPMSGEVSSNGNGNGNGRSWQTAPLWLATGICLALLLYCVVEEMWVGALLSGAASLAALLAGLSIKSRCGGGTGPTFRPIGGPYGNGPYRKTNCAPNGSTVAMLAEITANLRALPEKQPGDWNIDWQPFDDERAAAAKAAEQGDYLAAVRQYSHAIRAIMRQLREKRPTIDGDTHAI